MSKKSIERVTRCDFGTLRRHERTEEGYVFFEGIATKAGVFPYLNPDGSTRLEYRSPEEVKRADSLATLGRKPITKLHPERDGVKVLVNPTNAAEYAAGAVGEEINVLDKIWELPAERGPFVRVTGVVHRQDAIDAIYRDGYEELSCGYDCDLIREPGVTPEGERYDAIQKNITYNHLALVPRGRAGYVGRGRFDAAPGSNVAIQMPEGSGSAKQTTHHEEPRIMATRRAFRTDSISVPSDQMPLYNAVRGDMQDMEEERKGDMEELKEDMKADMEKKADSSDLESMKADMSAKYDEVKGLAEQLQGGLDALKKIMLQLHGKGEDGGEDSEIAKVIHGDSAADLKKALAEVEANRMRWHRDRMALERVAGELRVDAAESLDDAALRRAIFKAHTGKEVRADASEEYIQGAVESILSAGDTSGASNIATGQALNAGRQSRADDAGKPAGRAAYLAARGYK